MSTQLPSEIPTIDPVTPAESRTGIPQHRPNTPTTAPVAVAIEVRSRIVDHGAELVEGRGARGTVRGRVHPTRQPDPGDAVGECVDAVTRMLGDAWKPTRSASSIVLTRDRVTVMSGRSAAISARRSSAIFQFGQPSKYNRAMSMPTTLILDPHYKVKR